jgi:hypothetical protein
MNKIQHNIKFLLALFIACFFLSNMQAQKAIDYSGIWNGKFYDNAALGNPDETYRFEVQIAQTGKGLEGVTYSYQSTRFYGKAAHNGFIKTDNNKLIIQETRMIELKMDIGVACLMTCTMKYSKIGEDEYLEGTYTAIEENSGRGCPGGYVKLKKIKKSIFGTDPKVQKKLTELEKKQNPIVTNNIVKKGPIPSVPAKPKTPERPKPPVEIVKTKPPVVIPKPVIKNDTPQVVKNTPKPIDTPKTVITPPVVKIAPPPVELQQRKTELVQQIAISDTNELIINFYDFGEIDGDIVTIYVNNKLIISKQTLSTKPIQVPIKLSPTNPVVEVIMYADNLGTIPPNTAYMSVRANGQKYEATIESTEQKNASIKFVYQSK